MVFGRHMLLGADVSPHRPVEHLPAPLARHDLGRRKARTAGPSRRPKRASGHALLLANPHLAWFGFSQLFEAHVRSAAGWDFAGAAMYGSPVFSLGHNDRLGWTLTTNEPDIADLWRVTFDDPEPAAGLSLWRRLSHRDRIARNRSPSARPPASRTARSSLRQTHHGPVVAKEDEHTFLAARIAGLDDRLMLGQSLRMMRARSLDEFRQALAMQQFPLMNIVYADQDGNIFYLYNGLVPRRDPAFDWTRAGRRRRSQAPSGRGCSRSTICRNCSIPRAATCRTAIRAPSPPATRAIRSAEQFPTLPGRRRRRTTTAAPSDRGKSWPGAEPLSLRAAARAGLRHHRLLGHRNAAALRQADGETENRQSGLGRRAVALSRASAGLGLPRHGRSRPPPRCARAGMPSFSAAAIRPRRCAPRYAGDPERQLRALAKAAGTLQCDLSAVGKFPGARPFARSGTPRWPICSKSPSTIAKSVFPASAARARWV